MEFKEHEVITNKNYRIGDEISCVVYKFPISHNPLRKVSLIQSFKQNFFKIPSDQYQFSWFIHAFENGFLEEILEDDVFFKIAVLLIEPMLHTLDNNTHNEKAFIEATITKMVNKPPEQIIDQHQQGKGQNRYHQLLLAQIVQQALVVSI